MNELPRGWGRAPVGVLSALNPKTDAPDETLSGFAPMQMLGTTYRGRLGHEPRAWGEVKKAYTHFRNGDVLLAKVTPCFENGKAGIATGLPSGIGAGSSEFYVLRPNTGVDCRYLLAYLSTADFRRRAIMAMTGAVGLRRVPRDFLISDELPVAPSAEQKRIADKLDTVHTRVDAVNTRLARVAPLLKRFRQSVLAAATSGRLVGAVKQDASKFIPVVLSDSQRGLLPDSWSWRSITELARLESGHTPRKSVPEYWDGGSVPWLSLQDIRAADGRVISETKLKPTMLGIDNSSARLLPAGTVCFCRDISFGYVTIMGRDMATSQHFVNWVCGAELDPRYLMFALMAARDSLSMSGQGTTVTTMYMPALKVLQLATPPIEIQTEIVRRVEILFAFADRLEARLQAAQTATDRLTPSLLAKAFRGELVPQDPNDEPAAELLRRLQTNASPKPATKRGRRAIT